MEGELGKKLSLNFELILVRLEGIGDRRGAIGGGFNSSNKHQNQLEAIAVI